MIINTSFALLYATTFDRYISSSLLRDKYDVLPLIQVFKPPDSAQLNSSDTSYRQLLSDCGDLSRSLTQKKCAVDVNTTECNA